MPLLCIVKHKTSPNIAYMSSVYFSVILTQCILLTSLTHNDARMSAKDLDDRNSSKIEAGSGGEAEEEVSLSL